jgi:multiple sugar transport system permease protein
MSSNPHKVAARRRNAVLYAIAGLLLFIWAFPIFWAVVVSLKSEQEVLAYPPRLFFEPTLRNYRDALVGGFSILPSFTTSFIVSGLTTILTIVFAVPCAYAFARLKLRGKKWLGFYTLVTQMVPPVGLVIPYFLILNRVGWLDTYQGMVIVYLTFSLPFAIWLMVSYMEDIPREMEEAAFLDKANRFQTLWHVILPQVRGGIAVTVIFVFLNAWNEFLFAVQLGGNDVRPVTVAMYNFVSVEQTLWAKLSAAALIAMLPMIIIGFAAQRQIVKGLTVGAVKGGGRR